MPDSGNVRLSSRYEWIYADLLRSVAAARRIRPRDTSLFWPKVGRLYDGDLLIVGRSVNGWIDRCNLDQTSVISQLAAVARRTGEGKVNGCPMGWVLDRWKRRDKYYDTSRNQFWVTARHVALAGHAEREADWPSYLAWSNLTKVSPWGEGNPSLRLRSSQLGPAARLLACEVKELAPRRVLVMAGRDWFEPYVSALGLRVEWNDGVVQGIAGDAERRWVITVHPMTRSPQAVASAALDAFESDT